MKERISNTWSALKAVIRDKDYTARESVLAIIVVFLTGIILGALLTPKKETSFCSNNGNNNGSNNGGVSIPGHKEEEKEEEDEEAQETAEE